jgi:hypothetical protein
MADQLQESWDQLMGKKPKGPSVLWLILGMVLGIAVQVGPGALAAFAGWSAWWAVAWGFAIAFHSTVIKSNIGRGMLSGSLPPHWLSALVIFLPLSTVLFSTLNLLAYWLVSWLLH